MMNRTPTTIQIATASRYSQKPRVDIANFWKNMDRALVLAMRSTVLAYDHARRAHRIACRLRRDDFRALAFDLMTLTDYRAHMLVCD